MNTDFWRGKRVLLTGHTGFKGSWLALWLQMLGAEVIGYSLAAPTEPNLYSLARVGQGMQCIIGDIRNLEALKEVFSKYKPQIVFHLAAQSLVRPSYDSPLETYTTNVIGTANVLDAVRHTTTVSVVINITSDKCYDNREWLWGYRENEPMGGVDPYSSSKGCAELITAAYRSSYFSSLAPHGNSAAIATARAGNVIGGGDWAKDRLVPDIMRSVKKAEPVVIRNPDAIRPWQHVLEPLSGYLLLAENLWHYPADFSEGWNFGPNREDSKSVRWLVERICKEWGLGAAWEFDQGTHPHEARFLFLDSSKARLRLQWCPRWSLDTTINAIIEWYRVYFKNFDVREITLSQITDYDNYPKPLGAS